MAQLKTLHLIGLMMKPIEMNVLTLAYIGDAIYEIHIRKHLVSLGIIKVKELQTEAVKYVSARGQSKYLEELIELNFFSEEELSLIKRSRNNKGKSHPKNTDIVTYKHATALESLIGYLYLENNLDRIDQIMGYIIGE